MNKLRKAVGGSVAVLLATTVLAACGDAPDKNSSSSPSGGGSSATSSDFLPCIVSDAGGFDDKSFNQLSFEGVKEAAAKLGTDYKAVESNSDADYAPNIDNLVAQGCDVIVTVGFNLAAATKDAAKANPDIKFVLIDDAADGGADGQTFDGKADEPNIKPLLYDTAQAAFLAGYAAADYSKTGVVGTYGGQPYPTVTIFMDGFKQGVDYFNKQNSKSVKVVGWDGKNGLFTGGFEANEKATNTAKQIIDQNADVILPVGGPIYQGAVTAIADSGKDIAMIGVDADLYQTDPKTRDVVMTSILKNMKISTYEAVTSAADNPDNFDFSPYVGTLENDGVGIAPFHNFESKVPADLSSKLDEIKKGIIDGSIPVNSYLNQ